MSAPEQPLDVDGLRARATQQGSVVRHLKKEGAPAAQIAEAVAVLKEHKAALAAAEALVQSDEPPFDRAALEQLLRHRMFVVPAFEIYGGVAGLYDFGPPGCGLKANVLALWRSHFVLEEQMLELECPALTADIVLRTSGHVEKFVDLMVRDTETGDCYRADKLLEDAIEALGAEATDDDRRVQRQADAYAPAELHELLQRYGVTAPNTGNALTEPFPFNLMFATQIGPEGGSVGYLRPETAQGMFTNFRRLLDFNAGRVPFAAAQIGSAFRNEIAPRAGLLRVREFQMAEIEHFVHPEEKAHPKFAAVAGTVLNLFDQDHQLGDGKTQALTIGEAVGAGTVDNETLGYFMARTQLFALRMGLKEDKLRFRQHLRTEMAHYASDCWDLEVNTSYGWIECVGHADRACYDLTVHAERARVDMTASRRLAEPREVESLELRVDKKAMGKAFRGDMKQVQAALEALEGAAAAAAEAALEAEGELRDVGGAGSGFTVTRAMARWERVSKTVHEERFCPSVIEPSFGIGRLIYALFEHSYYVRPDDAQRGVFGFSAAVAPIKAAVLPLSNSAVFAPDVDALREALTRAGLSCKVDSSSTAIGRRYARADELGVPFALTVDFETAATQTVTLRERDSCAQVRIPVAEAPRVIKRLCTGRMEWAGVAAKYPVVSAASSEEGAEGAAAAAPAPAADIVVEDTGRGRLSRPGSS